MEGRIRGGAQSDARAGREDTVEIGLRVLALIIDLVVCFSTVPLVVGGLGWIMGLFGLAAYMAARRKDQGGDGA